MEFSKPTAVSVLEAAVSASGHTLTPYQRAFLADPSPMRAVLKARQTGFSWLFALEALSAAVAAQCHPLPFVCLVLIILPLSL